MSRKTKSILSVASSPETRDGEKVVLEFLLEDSKLVGFGAQQVPGFPAGLKVSLYSPPFNAVRVQAAPVSLLKLSKDGFDSTSVTMHPMLLAVSYNFILIYIYLVLFFYKLLTQPLFVFPSRL